MMTPEQQAHELNTKPSGKTGHWHVEGQGVVYRHGANNLKSPTEG